MLRNDFGEATRGSFTVLFEAPASRWSSARYLARVESSLARAARVLHARPSPLRSLTPRVAYAALPADLDTGAAIMRTAAVERALGKLPGTRIELTGFPVVAEQLATRIEDDLHRAELIAIPAVAAILLLFFGSLPAAAIPLLFGLATILVTIGAIWLETWLFPVPVFATNVVTLVGIALAVDYSLLYVARFREEAREHAAAALPATARTAGRALAISGIVVAAGLAPLVLIPIPFFRGLGLATVVIPLISTLAAVTLLPALIEVLAPYLERRPRRRSRRSATGGPTTGERLTAFVTRRAPFVAGAAATLLLVLALPALSLGLTGGSGEFAAAAPHEAEEAGAAAAILAPEEVLVDSGAAGGAWKADARERERRLLRRLARDPAVEAVQAPVEASSRARAMGLGLLDPQARFARIRVSGAFPSGSPGAEAFVQRLRSVHLPAAGFHSRAWVGGPAAADRDFIDVVRGSVPTLVVAIAVVMFVLLTVLLHSPILSLKAIAMSAISVMAACGILVAIFQFGWAGPISPDQPERIVAWVPVLLFAALFGISTDYEIFMVTRMREEWLRSGNNERAVRTGLRLVSGMITASALVMLVIFAGFTVSTSVALRQFGIGLLAGVVIDATVVRLLLVPALMKLMGRWNWSFPPRRIIPAARPVGSPEGR